MALNDDIKESWINGMNKLRKVFEDAFALDSTIATGNIEAFLKDGKLDWTKIKTATFATTEQDSRIRIAITSSIDLVSGDNVMVVTDHADVLPRLPELMEAHGEAVAKALDVRQEWAKWLGNLISLANIKIG